MDPLQEACAARSVVCPDATHRRNGAAGFSLLELMIVVLILGIILLLAQPGVTSSLEDARIRAAAAEVSSMLRYAQTTARNTGRACKVTFNVSAESLVAEEKRWVDSALLNDPSVGAVHKSKVEGSTAQYWKVMPYPGRPTEAYLVNFASGYLFGGVDIVATTFTPTTHVEFDPRGIPNSGGKMTIRYGSRTVAISVDAKTGLVTDNL